ncbi:MAG TPA: polysaccharide biosynthesis C-terminal domain-containing protein [Candidatus Eisenbacteria bacterium]|nr:polysaccharide biosynthesis C-terminal domain-containing protein [Candidatus Eisenbacteria bacterium]
MYHAAVDAALWIDRLNRIVVSAGGPIFSAITGVIRNKWLAVHLDVAGIGILAQVASGSTWLGLASGLGLALPLTRSVAAASSRDDDAAARRSVWTALSLVTIAGLGLAVACVLLAEPISEAILGTPAYAGLVRISSVAVLSIAVANILLGALAGRSDLKAPLAFFAAGGAVSVALTMALVPRFGLTGGTWGTILVWPAGMAAVLFLRRRELDPITVPRPTPVLAGREARALLGVGIAALSLSLLDVGTLLALRAHYLRTQGVEWNGLLQAALALSQQIGAVFYAYYSGYAFGKVSAAAAAGGADAVRAYTVRQWRPITLLAMGAFAFAVVAATPLLHVLYSDRFDAARPLMAASLFGEYCRVAAHAWGLGSLPLGGRSLWLRIGITQPLVMGAAYAWFASAGAGEMALPYAYAAAGLATLAVSVGAMSGKGVRPRGGDVVWLILSLALLGTLAMWRAG